MSQLGRVVTLTLHLEVDNRRLIAAAFEYLRQRWNALQCVFIARELRMPPIEPGAGVNVDEVSRIEPTNGACHQSRSFQRCVVNHNWHAIARESHVELYSVGANT